MSKLDLIISVPKNRTIKQLQRLQALPLNQKIELTLRRIDQFYTIENGNVYTSFSGGKDSTVLLDLIRRVDSDNEALFVDTGLEFNSIRTFVNTFNNVTTVKPKIRFDEVIKKHGYPVVSKEVSRFVKDLQNPTNRNARTRRIRLEGSEFKGGKSTTGKLSNKWVFLKDAPFKCSDICCNIMKKNPAKNFTKKTGKVPFLGTMTEESTLRKQLWTKSGCNIYNHKIPKSTPLSFWTEGDIWNYIKSKDLPYADIYDKGAYRTGCVFCMFGYWSKNDHKTQNDRMDLLKRVEPQKYNYCMKDIESGGLGLKKVIDYIDIKLNHGQPELEF